MSDTDIRLGADRDVESDGKRFDIGAHSDVMHGFYSGDPPWTKTNEKDAWVISINAKNGVVDAGRHEIPGKILLRNGQKKVMLILDGATGEIQQAGDIATQGDVLVMRDDRITIRLDGDTGDLLLGGGTPNESHIWLQSSGGKAYLGGNIRLEGSVGRATLGKPVAGGGSGASGSLTINSAAGDTRIQLTGEQGNAQFGGNVSIGTTRSFPEQLHVEGKTVVAGSQAELFVAGTASIKKTLDVGGKVSVGTTAPHDEWLYVNGSTRIGSTSVDGMLKVTGNVGVGTSTDHSDTLYVGGNARIEGQGARLDVIGPASVVGDTDIRGTLDVHGNGTVRGSLVVSASLGVGAPATVAKGKGVQVSDSAFASMAVRAGDESFVGLGADKGAKTDMIYWDQMHDLVFCTQSSSDGAGKTFEVMKITHDGKVFVHGIELDGIKGDIRLPNADCAEDFDIADQEELEPGTVVVIEDDGKLRRSQTAYDRRVAGVISGAGEFRPGLVLDQQRNPKGTRMPVALMGKVFCKVDADLSPIAVGDLLTPAPTAGHAMKATDPARAFGAVIGKALRALSSGKGLIPVLVALQ